MSHTKEVHPTAEFVYVFNSDLLRDLCQEQTRTFKTCVSFLLGCNLGIETADSNRIFVLVCEGMIGATGIKFKIYINALLPNDPIQHHTNVRWSK